MKYKLNESKTAITKDDQVLRLSKVVALLNSLDELSYLESLLNEYGNQNNIDCLCEFITTKIERLKNDN